MKKLFTKYYFFCFVVILSVLVGNFDCKKSCGSAAEGALNLMSLAFVSAQIIINVVNSVNDNNNNNNNNNNDNNDNNNNNVFVGQ